MKTYKSAKWGERIRQTYGQLIKEWGVPVEERDVPTRYGTTRVNVCGKVDGAPLMLFHGVGDDSALMWIYNAKALAERFRVYAVDTIGGPGLSVPNENYNESFDDAVWIDDILKFFALDRVCVAGVSHGGYLTQYYTLMRPERVIKALAMASSVPTSEGGSPMKTMMKIFMPEAMFPTQKNVVKLLKKLSGNNSAAFTDHPLIVEHYTCLLHGFNNMAMRYHKVTPFTDAQIDVVRGKCLYLVGEEDPFAKLGGKAALIENKMNAEFFEGVGHGINHEIAGVINQKMLDYFGQ